MADLDDFFAKKDRKKGKSTKKFATTEEVAKKLEDTAKKATNTTVEVKKSNKERVLPEGEEANQEVQEQDEWKDFEEEKKDYSGLKIGNLTLGPNGEQGQTGTSNEAGSGEPSEGGEQNMENEKKPGPWKRIETTDAPPQPQPEPVRQAAPAVDSPNVKGGVYVPPSKRGDRPTPQSNQPPSSRLRNRGVAPDIHNEEFFPTLSKSGDNKKTRNEGSFEMVQPSRASSYRNQQAEQNKMAGGPKLSLGNRYNTLSGNNDS